MPKCEHVSEQQLELYLTGRLLDIQKTVIEVHLHECRSCVIKLSETDDFLCELERLSGRSSQTEKETYPRSRALYKKSAVLRVLNPFSFDYWNGRILDLSNRRLRLHVPAGVLPGSLVKVRMMDAIAVGDARYCVPAPDGFCVGVRLRDPQGLAPIPTWDDEFGITRAVEATRRMELAEPTQAMAIMASQSGPEDEQSGLSR